MKRVLAGPRAVTEALQGPHRTSVAVVYIGSIRPQLEERIRAVAGRASVQVEPRSAQWLAELAGGLEHQGVIAVTGQYPYQSAEELLARPEPGALLVALDEITDPHNLGAIIRSSAAFGARGVLILKNRSAQISPVVVRTSAGATEQSKVARVTNLAQTLSRARQASWQVIGLAPEGPRSIRDLEPAPSGRIVVIGSEGRGLRRLVRERCDELVHIPLSGPIDSLNASVAAGIALFACAR